MAWTGFAGLVMGLCAALSAAAVDVARASDVGRYLPNGRAAFFCFLLSLYAALSVPVVEVARLGLAGLARLPLLRQVLHGTDSAATEPMVPRWQVAAAGVVALALSVAVLRPAAAFALQRFHHRGLLALLLTGYAVLTMGAATLLALLGLSAARPAIVDQPSSGPLRTRGATTTSAGPLGIWLLVVSISLASFLMAAVATAAWIQQQTRWPLGQRATVVAVGLPTMGFALLSLGLALAGLLRRRLQPPRRAPDGWLVRVLCLLLPLLGSVLALARQQADALRIVDLRPIVTVLVAITTACACGLALHVLLPRWPTRLPPRLARRTLWLLSLLLPGLAWTVAVQLGSRESLRKAGIGLVPLCERIIQTQALLLDFDGDGAAGRLSVGGTDCDDLDASRHPGAFDWPDNGVDENCNAHDATTQPIAAASSLPLPAALPRQPNIVLVTVDALRSDHVSTYGYKRATTPQLDALAADPDSVVFDSAWAHAPSTRYSVPAILTGRYPSTIVWGSPQHHWPPEVLPQNRLISEMLRERGYSTTALLSYHYFEPSWGLARGFSDYDTHLMVLHSMGGDPAATSGSSARELADLALAKLPALLASEKPFFLWAHFYDPHFRYERHPLEPGDVAFGEGEQDLYDEEIRFTDRHIGRLLAALRQSPAWNRTSVLVTADHGEGFGEHGIPPDRRHGYHLYANQTRVPFILRLAGLRQAFPSAPRRLGIPVGHVDIVPTILHSVLRQVPQATEKQLLGQSLLPILSAPEAAANRTVFQEVMYEGPTVRKALVTARWHLIQNLIPDGTVELYDLNSDPGETRDLAGQHESAAEQRELTARLSAWMDDSAVPPDFATRVAGHVTTTAPPIRESVSARIGECLDIVGAEQSASALRPNETLDVTVVYRARCRLPAGYRLFFHLRSDGGPFVNADHDFLDGLVPAQNLPVGRFVRDVTHIRLPAWFPRGPATLQVGLFQRNTRMPVSGTAGQVRVNDRAVLVGHVQVTGP